MPLPPPPRCLARLPRIAALVAVIGAMVLAGVVATVGAQTATTVEVTPAAVAPGQQVIVRGFGFQAGETVSIDLGGATIGSAVVDDGGAFQAIGTLPAEIAPGMHPMAVTGDLGSLFTLIFEVVAVAPSPTPAPTAIPTGPELRVLPESAAPGAVITVTGGGYGPGEAVTVRFDGVELATVGSTIAGAFLANVVIPVTTAPGSHTIEVTGARGRQLTGEYVVSPPPTPTATPAATSEATPVPTATASPSGGDVAASATPSDGTPGVPSGDGSADGGDGSRTWGQFPSLFIASLAVIGAVLGGFYQLSLRRSAFRG